MLELARASGFFSMVVDEVCLAELMSISADSYSRIVANVGLAISGWIMLGLDERMTASSAVLGRCIGLECQQLNNNDFLQQVKFYAINISKLSLCKEDK